MADTVIVTGGAGYVGSHACLRLAERGYTPVVLDSLCNGHEAFVRWGPLDRIDILDRPAVEAAFKRHKPVGVLHFAALIEVGESVRQPAKFYQVNVGGAAVVADVAQAAGVKAFVFSSTCATYGDPMVLPLTESHPQAPINPYGRTKLAAEQLLSDVSDASAMRYAILRYFNAAGADPEGRLGERHDPETHALPLLLQAALGRRPDFSVYGSDYDTRDGTAVRDYVHVLDLADAHVAALSRLLQGAPSDSFNLGTGVGATVRELIQVAREVTRADIAIVEAARRPGDAPALVADNSKTERLLGWRPRYDLRDIVKHAWAWHSRHEASVFPD